MARPKVYTKYYQTWIKEYLAGNTIKSISIKYNCHTETVTSALKQAGIEIIIGCKATIVKNGKIIREPYNISKALTNYVLSIDSGCWEWNGCANQWGYPMRGKRLMTRESYKHYKGDPGKLHVCHTCDNPKCINPEHLFLGTNQENMIDMVLKNRSPLSKITIDQIKEIKKLLKSGKRVGEIAKQFNINQRRISDINTGRYYSYV